MSKICFMPLLASLLFCASCSVEQENGHNRGFLVQVSLNGDVDARLSETKASGDPFDKSYLGVVGVAGSADNTWVSSLANYSNVGISIAAPGTVTLAVPIYLPAASYNFYSIATDNPEGLPVRDGDSYPVGFGAAAADPATGGDMIYAAQMAQGISLSNYAVQFEYNHLYALTRFELKQGEISSEDFKLCVPDISGAYERGEFNLNAAMPAALGGGAVLSSRPIDTASDYYMLPQTFTVQKPFVLNVTVGTKYRLMARAYGFTLAPSSKITFRATINVKGLEFGADGWQPGGDVENGFGSPGLVIIVEVASWNNGGDIDNGFGSQILDINYTLEAWKDGELIDNSFGNGLTEIPFTYKDWIQAANVENEFGK